MRRIVSFLFLLLMLLQAIPVLHFFSTQPEVFYVYIDEEKPEENSKEKKHGKESLFVAFEMAVDDSFKTGFNTAAEKHYSAPIVELLTPPPNALAI